MHSHIGPISVTLMCPGTRASPVRWAAMSPPRIGVKLTGPITTAIGGGRAILLRLPSGAYVALNSTETRTPVRKSTCCIVRQVSAFTSYRRLFVGHPAESPNPPCGGAASWAIWQRPPGTCEGFRTICRSAPQTGCPRSRSQTCRFHCDFSDFYTATHPGRPSGQGRVLSPSSPLAGPPRWLALHPRCFQGGTIRSGVAYPIRAVTRRHGARKVVMNNHHLAVSAHQTKKVVIHHRPRASPSPNG
jgi:hypothetical protein